MNFLTEQITHTLNKHSKHFHIIKQICCSTTDNVHGCSFCAIQSCILFRFRKFTTLAYTLCTSILQAIWLIHQPIKECTCSSHQSMPVIGFGRLVKLLVSTPSQSLIPMYWSAFTQARNIYPRSWPHFFVQVKTAFLPPIENLLSMWFSATQGHSNLGDSVTV